MAQKRCGNVAGEVAKEPSGDDTLYASKEHMRSIEYIIVKKEMVADASWESAYLKIKNLYAG